ncbi:hypothetical protein HE1_00473 [Holospora elegans E1]|uniref:Uncharacterized protein n=1 Tax=Holospora elegans E1 TaxID=1427503 RepID=A0A023DXK5_9PROT|nr:hypothetical protein [Holospora elegans]GAJ46148.1 hypothetical protein HE1_00473 [Holospora elegans E1]
MKKLDLDSIENFNSSSFFHVISDENLKSKTFSLFPLKFFIDMKPIVSKKHVRPLENFLPSYDPFQIFDFFQFSQLKEVFNNLTGNEFSESDYSSGFSVSMLPGAPSIPVTSINFSTATRSQASGVSASPVNRATPKIYIAPPVRSDDSDIPAAPMLLGDPIGSGASMNIPPVRTTPKIYIAPPVRSDDSDTSLLRLCCWGIL